MKPRTFAWTRKSGCAPLYDGVSIRKIRVPTREEMGVRVLDNCAEEHIM